MFIFSLYQIFSHPNIGDENNPLNEYSVYQTNSTNKLVNYKLKEDVKESSQSTDGLQTGSNNSTNNSSGDAKVDSMPTVGTDRVNELWNMIKKYSKRYNTDAVFVAVICAQESDFGMYPGTYDRDGYVGVMQLKESGQGPKQELKQQGLWESDMTEDVLNDDNSINIATKYLKYGYDRFVVNTKYKDDIGAWAAGYNLWWVTTMKYDPPFKPGDKENTNYYYQTKQRYSDYISGVKKIGQK